MWDNVGNYGIGCGAIIIKWIFSNTAKTEEKLKSRKLQVKERS